MCTVDGPGDPHGVQISSRMESAKTHGLLACMAPPEAAGAMQHARQHMPWAAAYAHTCRHALNLGFGLLALAVPAAFSSEASELGQQPASLSVPVHWHQAALPHPHSSQQLGHHCLIGQWCTRANPCPQIRPRDAAGLHPPPETTPAGASRMLVQIQLLAWGHLPVQTIEAGLKYCHLGSVGLQCPCSARMATLGPCFDGTHEPVS